MKACVFRLRMSEEPLMAVAGWLPSAEVGEWLEEARDFVAGHPGAGVRMHVVAGEKAGSVAGVVLVVTGVVGAVRFRPRVVALGEMWPGVLVPVRSRAVMALTATEVRAMFPRQVHFVHPVLGVTGWSAEEAVLPEEVLVISEVSKGGWMDAVPGVLGVAALRHLGLEEGREGDGFLASEAGGIGESAGVEPGPEGWSGAARRAGAVIGDLGAGALRAMGRDAAASRVDAWSRRFRQDLAERRKAEIERLLEAFGSDPAGALRRAIPLVGGGKGRGPGPLPGTVLGERPEEWDPMRNGSGGGDEWAVDQATRLRLERAYREAAVRESAAGRWLRAARIYGELLGDWAMAAQMLERAGRWREAARVYRERLRVPGKAAGCFESAGLLSEAVVAWREAGNHEEAGELLARLGQDEEARREWEQAVRVSRDPLKQAELLEGKLGLVERAMQVLEEAWRHGRNGAAFEEYFALLGRLGRHGEARGLLEEMGRHPERGVRPRTAMMAALRTVFLGYPEAGVRGAAAETALVVAGDALGRKQSRDAVRCMVTELARFFPGDVVLGDDAARYLAGKRMAVPAVRRAAAVRVPDRVMGPEAGGEGGCRWDSLGMEDGRVTVAGMRLVLPREVVWRDEKRPWVAERVLGEMELPETVEAVEHVMTAAGPVVLVRGRESVATWETEMGRVGVRGVLAVGPGGREGEWVLLTRKETGGLVAEIYGDDGELRRVRVIDLVGAGEVAGRWLVSGQGDDLWIAVGRVVCCVSERIDLARVEMEAEVTALAVSGGGRERRAVVVAGGRAVVLGLRGRGWALETWELAGEGVTAAGFRRDGRVVLAGSRGAEVLGDKPPFAVETVLEAEGRGGCRGMVARGASGAVLLMEDGHVLFFD